MAAEPGGRWQRCCRRLCGLLQRPPDAAAGDRQPLVGGAGGALEQHGPVAAPAQLAPAVPSSAPPALGLPPAARSATPPPSASGPSRSGFLLPNNCCLRPVDKYSIENGEPMGAGSFGTVRRARNKRSGQACAIKTMKKNRIPDLSTVRREVDISATLDHPNIAHLFEHFEDDRQVYLILELCEGNELFDRILEERFFGEQTAARLMQQILGALFYMHSQGIAHRDVKPENLLFKNEGSLLNNPLMLIDFGYAARFDTGKAEGTPCFKTKIGTPLYIAPEVLSGSFYEKCDAWSCGIILYILLSGIPPFACDKTGRVEPSARGRLSVSRPELTRVGRPAKELIKALCTLDPGARFSPEQALRSDWVQHPPPCPMEAAAAGPDEDFVQRLRDFRCVNRFKKAALHLIAHRLDHAHLSRLRSMFIKLDTNGDGTLTLAEVKNACGQAGLTDMDDLGRLFDELYFDGSGEIGYTEFLAAMIDQRQYLQEEVCWEAFSVFDRNGDGKLSFDELKEMLDSRPELEVTCSPACRGGGVSEILRAVDADGDGEICFSEFIDMLRDEG